jgi:chemotaxis protein MotB
MVPPELMKAFVDIARAGGVWEVGPGGTLKTSSDVFFDSGKTDLKPSGQAALKEIAPKLKNLLTDKRVMLAVEGHTDNVPILHSLFKDNRHLSLMRAHSVITFLGQQGVPPAAMTAVGYGEYHPIASNATPDGHGKNRRVELRLINAGSVAPSPSPAPAPAPEPAPMGS